MKRAPRRAHAKHRPCQAAGWLSCAAVMLLAAGAAPAHHQSGHPTPQALLGEVAFDQRLGTPLPLDTELRDEAGNRVPLAHFFDGRPVIFAFVYYECPMLCTQVLNGMLRALRVLSFDAGDEFRVVAVSIDPRESPADAAAKKANYVARYDRAHAAQGWHFLTGDEAAITALTDAVGFRYAYDAELGQYAHAAGILVLTPEGRVARYFYGIEYAPRDLRLALIEASSERIGSAVDQLLLYCYHYDPTTGRYGLVIMNVIRLAGIVTVLALAAFIWAMLRRDRRFKTRTA